MNLTINDTTYEVDMTALRGRAAAGMEAIIADKGDKNPILRQAVKAACTYAMSILGLQKIDRNDDPIQLVALHVAGMIFDGIEKEGLRVTGTVIPKLEPPKVEAPETEEMAEAPKEE